MPSNLPAVHGSLRRGREEHFTLSRGIHFLSLFHFFAHFLRSICERARITRIWLASWLAQVVGGTSGPDVGDPTKTLRGNASKQNRGEGEGGRRGGASAPTLRGHYGSSARRRVFFRTPSRSLQRGGSCSGPARMDLFAPGAATAQ